MTVQYSSYILEMDILVINNINREHENFPPPILKFPLWGEISPWLRTAGVELSECWELQLT
jgi:hypothetical protein